MSTKSSRKILSLPYDKFKLLVEQLGATKTKMFGNFIRFYDSSKKLIGQYDCYGENTYIKHFSD